MAVRSVIPGKPMSKFDLGDKVKTPSGLVGEIIGLSEYRSMGWEYRLQVPGRRATLYRWQDQLRMVMPGSKARREYWARKGIKKTRARRR
ncbi:hypothetical protein [Candidatus Magnetobacterium casense]|uniref:Uncharacterized protein n=1 Tax=Candidatus Magnetobacterium casense TaxID=1455061 RepID=A0ABS6S459_9BACT|nr:hypothetical protein [Candidatus Magnetobacterium casensis]MBV6343625.1 hypothetical protein [Candidatus Magnetobacterium casensis]